MLLAACGTLGTSGPAAPPPTTAAAPAATVAAATAPAATARAVSLSSDDPNVYAATLRGLAPQVADLEPRVYVPNEGSNSVTVIDARSYRVVGRITVGHSPQHVTPSWDLRTLYVNDSGLTAIDPRTATAGGHVKVAMPYNLYFTPDGSKAIVVAEELRRLDFFDRTTWARLGSLTVPCNGIDHLDFSATGDELIASCEFSGVLVKVDTRAMTLVSRLATGGLPIDVKLAPAGDVFFVTDQQRDGVAVIDPVAMRQIGFIRTGKGAHGLSFSRDTRSLYVSNRLAGTISVIDVATRTVRANWVVGGSPDMLTLSADGSEIWTGNRFANTVIVIDTATGTVTHTIAVEQRPHGLTYFPQPGRYSLGHNGVYR